MNLVDFLTDNYGYDQPIVLDDLTNKITTVKPNTIRRSLNRLAKSNKVYKYAFKEGIFFIPNPDSPLKNKTLSTNKVIDKLYLTDSGKRFGYITGLAFANILSFTTQNPFTIEITTNKTSSKKRDLEINKRRIILRKPKVEINNNNYKLLQVLDLISDFEKYTTKPINEVKNQLLNYLDNVLITKADLNNYLKSYPAKTSKKLIESELYDEITQK